MPAIPAFCDTCGTAFPSGFFAENCLNISLSGNRSGPCPKCGGMGHVPDGVFNVIGNTIEILTAPERTIYELTRLAEILQAARASGTKPEDVARDIEKELPSFSALLQLIPANRSEWFAFLGVLLAAIQIYLAACPPATNQTPLQGPNITINQVIEQTIIINQTSEQSSRNVTNRKIGRNEPCLAEVVLNTKNVAVSNANSAGYGAFYASYRMSNTSISLRDGHSFLCVPKEKNQKKGQPGR